MAKVFPILAYTMETMATTQFMPKAVAVLVAVSLSIWLNNRNDK